MSRERHERWAEFDEARYPWQRRREHGEQTALKQREDRGAESTGAEVAEESRRGHTRGGQASLRGDGKLG